MKKSVYYYRRTFEFDEQNNQLFRIVSLYLFSRWKTYNCQRCTFWSSSFLKQANLWICQYQLAKTNTFFKNKWLFRHYKCCTYQNISFFLPSGWNWPVQKQQADLFAIHSIKSIPVTLLGRHFLFVYWRYWQIEEVFQLP